MKHKLLHIVPIFTLLSLATSCSDITLPIDNVWHEVIEMDAETQTYVYANFGKERNLAYDEVWNKFAVRQILQKITSLDSVMSNANPQHVQLYTMTLENKTRFEIELKVVKDNTPFVYQWTEYDKEGSQGDQFFAVPHKNIDQASMEGEQYPDVDLKLIPTERVAGKRWIKPNPYKNKLTIRVDKRLGQMISNNYAVLADEDRYYDVLSFQPAGKPLKLWMKNYNDFLELEKIEENGIELYIIKRPLMHPELFQRLSGDTLIVDRPSMPPQYAMNDYDGLEVQGLKLLPSIYRRSYSKVFELYLSKGDLLANMLIGNDLTAYVNYKHPQLKATQPLYDVVKRISVHGSYPNCDMRYTIYELPQKQKGNANTYQLVISYQFVDSEKIRGVKVKSLCRILLDCKFVVPVFANLTDFHVTTVYGDAIIPYNEETNEYLKPDELSALWLATTGAMHFSFQHKGPKWLLIDSEEDGNVETQLSSKKYNENLTLIYDHAFDQGLSYYNDNVPRLNKHTWLLHSATLDGDQLSFGDRLPNIRNMNEFYPFEIGSKPGVAYIYHQDVE